MAKLKIKKYVNNNEKMPKAYGKTYGRIEHVDTLDTLDPVIPGQEVEYMQRKMADEAVVDSGQ